MRLVRKAFVSAVVAIVITGALSLLVPSESVAAAPPDNCAQPCKPFLKFGKEKCYFVGCDIDGICRYIC